MCEQMGIDPKDEYIPMEFSDLEFNSQIALSLFNILPDKIEGMNGVWLGKDFAGLLDIMNILSIEDKKRVFELLLICISEADKHYAQERKMRETMKH